MAVSSLPPQSPPPPRQLPVDQYPEVCPICAERIAHLRAYLERVLPLAEREHDAFLNGLRQIPPTSVLRVSQHALRRQVERLIGYYELRDLIETGEVMEYFVEGVRWRLITLVGETETGRLLHVLCRYASETPAVWWIVTAFDPTKEKAWWWSADGRRRVCFCPPPPDWVPDDE